jgi:hypothetical protein
MATIWADGFEDATAANLTPSYTTTGTWLSAAGRRAGSLAMRCSTMGSISSLRRSFPSVGNTVFVSFAIRPTVSFSASSTGMIFSEGGTTHILLRFRNTGLVEVVRGAATVLGSFTPNYVVWQFWQIRVVIHDTAGSVEIRGGSGDVIFSVSGVDTREGLTGVIDGVLVAGYQGTEFDDLHIWDESGSICNTWTGDTRIDTLYPTGAGDSTQFTPSAGANWQCVDEPDASAADFVSSNTVGHQDLYGCANLPHAPVSVFGVVRTAFAGKDDAGARSLALLTKSGSTVSAGTPVALQLGSNTRVADVLQTDPNTSAAWTQAGINAMQIGVEVA